MEVADVPLARVPVDPQDVLLEAGDRRPLQGDVLPDRGGQGGKWRAARHDGGGTGRGTAPAPPRNRRRGGAPPSALFCVLWLLLSPLSLPPGANPRTDLKST